MKLLLQLGKLVPNIKSYLIFFIISLLLVGLINIPAPFLFASIIDNALPKHNQSLLVILVSGLLLVELLKNLLNLVNATLLANISEQLIATLRSKMFKHYVDLPFAYFLETPSGKMVNRLATETESVGDFFRKTLWAVPLPFITTIMGTTVMVFWNWKMAIFVLLSMPVTIIATKGLSKRLRNLRHDQRNQQESFQGAVTEAMDNIRVIKGFAREEIFNNELGQEAQKFADFNLHSHFLSSCLRSSTTVIQLAAKYIFIIFGAYLVIHKDITLGDFFAFKFFQEIIEPEINTLFEYFAELPMQTVSIKRAMQILEYNIESGLDKGQTLKHAKGDIKFENINLIYPDGTKALTDINFYIKAGETIAIIGPSGSGKSSIASLLLGIYKPTSGKIWINNYDLSTLELRSLRKHIGIIYQDAELFNRSVRDNLKLANTEASDTEIWQALEMASAMDFVKQLPMGLNSIIGNKGVKLSGGQKQRLTIARTILKNPDVLILDEATSALDSISEKAIQNAMQLISKNKTSIIIAHRLSTISHADKIIVLDKSKIVQIGNHQDLLKQDGLYKKLYSSQMDGFNE